SLLRQLNSVVLPAPFGPIKPAIRPLLTVKLTFSSATIPPKRIVSCAISSKGVAAPAIAPAIGSGEVVMPIGPPLVYVSSSAPLLLFVFGRLAQTGRQNVTRRTLVRQREGGRLIRTQAWNISQYAGFAA